MPTAVERPNFNVFSREGADIQINFAVDTFKGHIPGGPQAGNPGAIQFEHLLRPEDSGDSLLLNIAVDPNNPNVDPPGLNVAGLDYWL
jgi:hypothetical protein